MHVTPVRKFRTGFGSIPECPVINFICLLMPTLPRVIAACKMDSTHLATDRIISSVRDINKISASGLELYFHFKLRNGFCFQKSFTYTTRRIFHSPVPICSQRRRCFCLPHSCLHIFSHRIICGPNSEHFFCRFLFFRVLFSPFNNCCVWCLRSFFPPFRSIFLFAITMSHSSSSHYLLCFAVFRIFTSKETEQITSVILFLFLN